MKRSGEWRPGEAHGMRIAQVASGEKEKKLSPGILKHASTFALGHRKGRLALAAWVAMACSLTVGGCGYHVAGRSSGLPKSVHTIAVPTMENNTASYRIEQKLTAATIHEFLVKTSYRIVPNAADGDAVLTGKVLSIEATPLLFDTKTGRATTMLVIVRCEVALTETATQKVLYHTDNFLFRNEYEISTDLKSFFEEQDPALDRLAQDFASRLVAAVTENY